jgi:hypothetical protein
MPDLPPAVCVAVLIASFLLQAATQIAHPRRKDRT